MGHMIQVQTELFVADNTGAKRLMHKSTWWIKEKVRKYW